MHRTSFVIVVLLACLSLKAFGGDVAADRRKAEIVAKADGLLGKRYSPMAGKMLYDEQTETGPPDAAIYWHNESYVIELIFAHDGSIARVELLPETLLYSHYWGDVPERVELSPAEMQLVVKSVNELEPLGKPREIVHAPNSCFQSGPNLYCKDTYERAVVSHYHQIDNSELVSNIALRAIGIVYRQSVSGIVEDVRAEGSELKIGGYWYHGEKPTNYTFRDATTGSVVHLVTFGCSANEKSCLAMPEQSKSITG
jgi:hypothetical protein